MNYYAVARGRRPGIYATWDECKDQVHKFPGAVYKKFFTKSEAQNYIVTHLKNSCSHHKKKQKGLSSRPLPPSYSLPEASTAQNQETVSVQLPTKESSESSLKTGYFEIKSENSKSKTKSARVGIEVYFSEDHPDVNNIRTEIETVIQATDMAKRYGMEKIKIYTYSEFLINCHENWILKWKEYSAKFSKNQPVIDEEELISMEKALAPFVVEFVTPY